MPQAELPQAGARSLLVRQAGKDAAGQLLRALLRILLGLLDIRLMLILRAPQAALQFGERPRQVQLALTRGLGQHGPIDFYLVNVVRGLFPRGQCRLWLLDLAEKLGACASQRFG